MADELKAITFDAYESLGVDETATEEPMVEAYQGVDQKWHPDKQPEHTKKALERDIHLLSQALEFLETRAAYEAERKRDLQLYAERRKIIEELEAEELSAFAQRNEERRAKLNRPPRIEEDDM
jgi:hypothetical protein